MFGFTLDEAIRGSGYMARMMGAFAGGSTANPHRNPNPYTQRRRPLEEKIAEDYYMEERQNSSLVQGPNGLKIQPHD